MNMKITFRVRKSPLPLICLERQFDSSWFHLIPVRSQPESSSIIRRSLGRVWISFDFFWFLEWFLNWNVRLIDTSLEFALKFATNWAIRLFLRNRKCALDPKFGFGNQFAKAVWLFGVHVWNTLCALLFSLVIETRAFHSTPSTRPNDPNSWLIMLLVPVR